MRVGMRNKWGYVKFPPDCSDCGTNEALVTKRGKHLCEACLTKPATRANLKTQGIEALLKEVGLL